MSMLNFDGICIVASGGLVSRTRSAQVEVYAYSISTDSWTAAPSLNEARFSHSSVVMGNCLYVCGGNETQSKLLDSIERLENA